MKEVCQTCKYCKVIVMFDYSHGGCNHTDYDEWACMAFASDGEIIHMVGLKQDTAHCEMWMRKFNVVDAEEGKTK